MFTAFNLVFFTKFSMYYFMLHVGGGVGVNNSINTGRLRLISEMKAK